MTEIHNNLASLIIFGELESMKNVGREIYSSLQEKLIKEWGNIVVISN